MTTRLTVLAIGLLGALSLTACTTSGSPSAGGTTSGVAATDAATDGLTDTAAPTDTPAPSDTVSSSSRATTSAPATSSATRPVPSKNTCPFAQLGIRALRGSGAQQREYAAILFTNNGTKPCVMYGFPGVSLRLAGRLLGQPAAREALTPKEIRLAPGGRAQAGITDFSSCNAPRSDTVRVYPPDSTKFVDVALDLRGCRITVEPVIPA